MDTQSDQRNQLIEIAKQGKETAFFSGIPPVYLIGGEPVTRQHFVATSGLAHMLPGALDEARQSGQTKAGAISNFLDILKASGIVISGEEFLRDDLLAADDWKRRFATWVELGRERGVTFHIAAGGHDELTLHSLFAATGMSGKHFFAHLRDFPVVVEPARPVF